MFKFYDQNRLNQTQTLHEHRILQPIWDLRLLDEETVASPIFPVILSVGSYFSICIFFCTLDMGLKHIAAVQKYKLQRSQELTWSMIYRALKLNLINNIFFILPATISQWIWMPLTPLPKLAPTLFEYLFQSWAILMVFDFQYWVWHYCHHKNRWLYRNFHAIHHQYHSTFSWTTQYLHPWELFTVGFFATVDGWFFDCHPMTYWSFLILNVVMSIDAHSGYDIPFFPHHWFPFSLIYGGGPKHDMHHMRPLTNFQPFFSTFDRLFGFECPGLRADGKKTNDLVEWETQHKDSQINKHATEIMNGSVNGLLSVGD